MNHAFQNTKKVFALLIAVLLLSLSFTACTSKKTEEPSTPTKGQSAGTFSMQGLHGETVTEAIFKESKLTLVNVMATWCGPCIHELPELQKLYQAYQDKGLSVLVIVVDTINNKGLKDEKAVGTAQQLAAVSGATFPMVMPQNGALAGKVDAVTSLPTTFFVDSEGNFVGKPYVGGKDLAGWSQVVEKLLPKDEASA